MKTKTTKNTHLTASFPEQPGKPAPERLNHSLLY